MHRRTSASASRVSLLAIAGILLLAAHGATQAPAAAHGVDVAGMDRSIKPGDDFFRFANGTWIRNTPIPPDRASWGLDAMLDEQATRHTRELLDAAAGAAPGSDERKAADYYAAYLDEGAIERRGLMPLEPVLQRIAAVGDRPALAALFGSMLRADVDPLNTTNFYTDRLFGLWVAQDFNDPSRHTAYLLQGGLGMPDREYYLATSAKMAETRATYRAHVEKVLRLAGVDGAAADADRIVALETKIARVHAERAQSEDVHAARPWARSDFDRHAPGLDWTAFFKAAGLDAQTSFIVWQPAAVTGEAALAGSEPLDAWKAYLRYIVINHWSGLLPKAFADERFDFYGRALSGTPQMPERWKRAVGAVNGAMGDAVGRLYVARYFPPEAKARAQAMVEDIKAAFAKRIDRLDWMAASTKATARAKVQALIVGVGYPDRWRDYAGLTVDRGDALGNAMRAGEFEYRYRVRELSAPVDRHEWWMTPQTVNAVNLPIQNALNFPAAILQPPYFDPGATNANNYGAIGSVIGHEVSHSFDDQGSQFDADGRLADWWTPDDFAHFKAASARLVAQYDAYKPLPDLAVNGRQTLGENIADVAGLAAAYDAYRLSLGGAPAPAQRGFTGDQQFFISFAQSWRDVLREPLLRQLIVIDGHAPSEYRADTVRNLDPWYAAFGVAAGARLYLAPADRVRIW
ncbi:MAG TPA: M13 family metallopeptidase [Vicinamibacterales bacterium]|nr:M13 family metallopeptidase [Vicinamibacterales bacterium]